VLEGLERWLEENGVCDVREIIGCALPASVARA
jgi:hypothetical protein